MDRVSLILAIAGTLLTVMSVTIAVSTFFFNRKKDTLGDGEFKGILKTDIEYIKRGVDELRNDNKEIKEDVGRLRERVSNVESLASAAHSRIDRMENNQREHA